MQFHPKQLKQRGVTFEDHGAIHDEFYGKWSNCRDLDNNLINLFESHAT
jgi:hypothetical protein